MSKEGTRVEAHTWLSGNILCVNVSLKIVLRMSESKKVIGLILNIWRKSKLLPKHPIIPSNRLFLGCVITSEAPGYPIESALTPDLGPGWRALQPGEQTVRLLFDNPLKIKRIRLIFQEDDDERTQEFILRWLPEGGQSYQEIVRQQYTFSPPGTAIEIEDYNVDLDNVTVLESKNKTTH